MKLLVVVSALIIYGSLYPFDVTAPADTWAAIREFFSNRELWTSRGDVLGNIGLFVPFGMVGVYAARGNARFGAAVSTVAGGLGLAFLIQVAQIWIASRSAVLSDVLWNGMGIVAGVVAGASLRSALIARRIRAAPVRLPALVLIGLWFLSELAPLVPSIDAAGIRRSLRFALTPPAIDMVAAFVVSVQVVLAGRLLADVVHPSLVQISLLSAVATVAAGKVLMVDLALTWTTVAGLVMGLAMWYLLSMRFGLRVLSGAVIGMLLVAYAFHALHPFTTGPPVPFLWIPFASVLDGRMLTNVRALAKTAFLLGGCLWLMRERGWTPIASTMAVAGFAFALEICQIWIPGRIPSSTEPALAILGGWALAQAPRGTDGPPIRMV